MSRAKDALIHEGRNVDLLKGDWHFANHDPNPLSGLHPYPAKFISAIPAKLINSLPIKPGTAVLDPFCGSGTTLVEAQAKGLSAIGIDLNPIAVLMSRVKTSPLPLNIGKSLSEAVEFGIENEHPEIPNIPRLAHWFEQPVQIALSALALGITKIPEHHRDVLRLALSSIVVKVSNQDSDTRYAAVKKKNIDRQDVFKAFLKAGQKIINTLSARAYELTPTTVFECDILSIEPKMLSQPVGLVITSPPYPNAYEYWLYHKYRMWWLGFDPLLVKEQEIGARAHFFSGKRHGAGDFKRQMASTFNFLSRVLIDHGHACFVIGRSRIHGTIVDNAETLTEVGAAAGFDTIFSTERTIAMTRKSFNLSHANIKTETVIVMKKRTGSCC